MSERRVSADEEVRALRDVVAQAEAALRAGPGRAHEGALPAGRLSSELKERLLALRRRVLLAVEWAGGAPSGEVAKHVGQLRSYAQLSASLAALKGQLTAGRAAMGGRSGGATVDGLAEVARVLGLQWDAAGGESDEVHFSAGNEAFLLDCHVPPAPRPPRVQLHPMARTATGPAVVSASAEAVADVERAVRAHDWPTLTRLLRYLSRLYHMCANPELRMRLDGLAGPLNELLQHATPPHPHLALPSAEGARVQLYRPPVPLAGDAAVQLMTVQAEQDPCGSELGPSLVYVARFHPPLLLPLPALAHLRALLLPAAGTATAIVTAACSPHNAPLQSLLELQHPQEQCATELRVGTGEVEVWGTRLRFHVQEPRPPLLTVVLLPFHALTQTPFLVRLAQQTALYTRLLRSCYAPHSQQPASPAPMPPLPVEVQLLPPEWLTLVVRAGHDFVTLRVRVGSGGELGVSFQDRAPLPTNYLLSVLHASHSLPVLLHYLLNALDVR